MGKLYDIAVLRSKYRVMSNKKDNAESGLVSSTPMGSKEKVSCVLPTVSPIKSIHPVQKPVLNDSDEDDDDDDDILFSNVRSQQKILSKPTRTYIDESPGFKEDSPGTSDRALRSKSQDLNRSQEILNSPLKRRNNTYTCLSTGKNPLAKDKVASPGMKQSLAQGRTTSKSPQKRPIVEEKKPQQSAKNLESRNLKTHPRGNPMKQKKPLIVLNSSKNKTTEFKEPASKALRTGNVRSSAHESYGTDENSSDSEGQQPKTECSRPKRRKLSQPEDSITAPDNESSIFKEDPKPTKLSNRTNMKSLLRTSKKKTERQTQEGERKSCRTRLGPINFWEQRLNYVYDNGVCTLDRKNPVKGQQKHSGQDLVKDSKIPIRKSSAPATKTKATGTQRSRPKKMRSPEDKLKPQPSPGKPKPNEPDEVFEANPKFSSILSDLATLQTELHDLNSKLYSKNESVSCDGVFRIKPGKRRGKLTCSSKTLFSVLKGYVKLFVDDVEQIDSKVNVKPGQTIEIVNCGKKEDCIVYFAEIYKGG